MNKKKIFGRSYVAVKNTVILAYFQYDEAGKVFYTMKVIGKRINPKEPVASGKIEVFDNQSVFYLHKEEPLMTVDNKQRTLPKAVLTSSLADDPKEFDNALEKLAGVLRNSRPFTAVHNEFL